MNESTYSTQALTLEKPQRQDYIVSVLYKFITIWAKLWAFFGNSPYFIALKWYGNFIIKLGKAFVPFLLRCALHRFCIYILTMAYPDILMFGGNGDKNKMYCPPHSPHPYNLLKKKKKNELFLLWWSGFHWYTNKSILPSVMKFADVLFGCDFRGIAVVFNVALSLTIYIPSGLSLKSPLWGGSSWTWSL